MRKVGQRDCGRNGDGAAIRSSALEGLKGVGLVEARREGRQML